MRLSRASMNQSPMLLAAYFVLAGACLAFGGCGGSSGLKAPPREPQATVSGTLLKDGKPLSLNTSIVFYFPEKSVTAAGKADALGKFSLSAADSSIGIPAGKYQVMVRPPAPPPAAAVGSKEYEKMMTAGDSTKSAKPPSEVPDRFLTFESSKLVLEVKVGPNTFDLDLAKLP